MGRLLFGEYSPLGWLYTAYTVSTSLFQGRAHATGAHFLGLYSVQANYLMKVNHDKHKCIVEKFSQTVIIWLYIYTRIGFVKSTHIYWKVQVAL